MTLQKAIEILEYHQEWRQGKQDEMIYEPKVLTRALDVVLEAIKQKYPCGAQKPECEKNSHEKTT
jgi:hypothetical protein